MRAAASVPVAAGAPQQRERSETPFIKLARVFPPSPEWNPGCFVGISAFRRRGPNFSVEVATACGRVSVDGNRNLQTGTPTKGKRTSIKFQYNDNRRRVIKHHYVLDTTLHFTT